MAEPIDTGNKTISGRTIWNDPETGKDYSERSTTFQIEGKYYTMPTVSEDGRQYTEDQIKDYVKKYGPVDYLTGETLPEFRYREDAIQYAISRSSTRKPKMSEGGLAAQTEEALGWTAEGEKFADANPVEVAEEEPTALSIADVPVFDRPMDASENDKWTGVQDELGNREYITAFGRKYFVRLADDQRTNYEKIQQDIIPAVQSYLDNPTAPSREQTINFLKESLGAAWETFKIPGDLAAGNKGMGDVTLGNIFELAGGTGALSTVTKVPGDPSNTTRTFGGPAARDYRNRALQKAAQMRSEGASPEEIEKVTGRVATASPGSETSAGFSNQFKFEIPDVDIKIENPIINYAKANGLTVKESLEQVTDKSGEGFGLTHFIPSHSELFKQYPGIKNVIVNFTSDPNYSGLYSPAHNSISISTELFEGGVNSTQFRSTFFHELQHAVQAQDAIETGMNFIANNPVENIKVLNKTRKDSSANEMFEVHLEKDKKLLQTRSELLALGKEILKNPNSKKVSKKLAYKYAQLKDELYLNYLRYGKEVEARIAGARSSGTQGRSVVEERAAQLPDRVEFNYKINKPPNFLNRLSKKLGLNQNLTPESEQKYLNEAMDFITDYTREEDYSIAKAMMKSLENKVSNQGFAQGGVVDMNNQMEMLFDEGGIADDGMRRDPVSGNEIPPGSLAEEVRDDIPAQLSEGEYVVPADVVRFFGVKYFEDLRTEAKMGLSNMEANGRIGGEPIGPSGMEENPLTPEEMAVLEQMGMAIGGFVPEQEPPQAVGNSVQGFAPGGDVQPTTNYGDTAAGLPSWAAIPGASYMPQEWQKENLPSTTSYKPVQTITTADSTPTTTTTTDTATDTVTATTGKEACEKMGMLFDEATQQCVLKQSSSTSDDPTVTPTTGESQGFEWKEPDVDYFSMSDEDLAKVGLETSNKFEDKIVKAGSLKLFGGAGLAGFGLFDSVRQGSTIAEVRSAALVAAAKGNTALADTLNARAKELVGKSSLLVQGADYFGALSGTNGFAQQIAAFSPAGFKLDKKLFGDNENAYKLAVDAIGKSMEKRYDSQQKESSSGVTTAEQQKAILSSASATAAAKAAAEKYKEENYTKGSTSVTTLNPYTPTKRDDSSDHTPPPSTGYNPTSQTVTTDPGGQSVTETTYTNSSGDSFTAGADEDGLYKGGLMKKRKKK